MSLRPVLIMAGGTGGHVVPALSVAEELQRQGVPVHWLGTKRGIEARLVPAAGIPIHWLSIAGLRGKGVLGLLSAPLRISWAVLQALGVILKLRPQAVLGMGGFASGPGGVAAFLLRRRLVIHEQNAVAGMTNRWLAKMADVVCAAFPQAFPAGPKLQLLANPVRDTISQIVPPEERFAGRNGPLRLLVLGGSQGATALNDCVPVALTLLELPYDIRHQAGIRWQADAAAAYAKAGLPIEPLAYIDDMAEAYAWADVIICRAGALTVAEVCAAGLPALFVPFPHAVDDHQTQNAAGLVAAGAGRLLPQDSLTPEQLAAEITELADRSLQLRMAEAARSMAEPDAAKRLAALCLQPAPEVVA